MKLIVLNRQAKAVAHEVDVPLNGFGGDLQFVGQLSAVGEVTGNEPLMQAHHPLQRRT
jgi:hypothetical protein